MSPLAKAEQSARMQSDSQAVEETTVACPLTSPTEIKDLEIKVSGDDGVGLDGIDLLIQRSDGQVLTGKTGPTGLFRFKGLDAGNYELGLPGLDQDAWEVKDIQALPDAGTHTIAPWKAAAAPVASKEQSHIIKQGECLGKIAEQYGFFPQTIWDHPANQALKSLRHDKMHILLENDRVVIPDKRYKTETVAAGHQALLLRLGVPERLRIRFLHDDESPRAGVPYLLSISTGDDSPLADIAGQTTGEGFIDQPIPPRAVSAIVILDPGPRQERHTFNIGFMDPIDRVSGWQARLNSLGYECGAQDNVSGPRTKAAIRRFQRAKNLPETGEADPATQDELLRTMGS